MESPSSKKAFPEVSPSTREAIIGEPTIPYKSPLVPTPERTTSNTALLQQMADEAVFEVPAEALHNPGGKDLDMKSDPQEGSATRAGLSGLIRNGWRSSSMDTAAIRMRRNESAAQLKKHKLVLETIIYNPNAPLKTLVSFQGTALKMVVLRFDFWLLISLNIFFNLAFYLGTSGQTTEDAREAPAVHGWPAVNIVMIGTSGSLLSFFLVFFNSESYKRFFDQYKHVRNIEHAMSNVGLMLRTTFRDGLLKHANTTRRDIFRYLTAAQYLGLAHLPQYKSDGMGEWAESHLESLKILSVDELATLRARPGRLAYKECLLWCLQRLWVHTENKDIESRIYQAYERNILDVRKSIQELYNYTSQPVPFAYFHLVNFLLLVYLAVNAYAFTFFTAYWSILGYTLFAIALLGLRELGVALADPFGDDETDLPVFSMLNEFFEESEKALNDPPLIAPELV